MLDPMQKSTRPDFLAIGHVTRDLLPGGAFTLGGTVTFAALTARHLGLASAVVTCADEALLNHGDYLFVGQQLLRVEIA